MDLMNIAIEEALISYNNDEIPVGAVLVKDGKIVSKSHNKRELENNIISHAEINCILEAASKLKTWKLNECDLYVTLKPCSMCEAVIKQSRIRNVYYLLDKKSEKKEYYKTKFIKFENESHEKYYCDNLSKFFKNKRK
ncbi:MAG: nucleoside deaminase [bacterium]